MRPHVPGLTPNEDLAIIKHQKPISGNIDEEIEERKVTSKIKTCSFMGGEIKERECD